MGNDCAWDNGTGRLRPFIGLSGDVMIDRNGRRDSYERVKGEIFRSFSDGRLAMFAAAGFLAQETVTGKTWGQQDIILENKVLGPLFEAASVEAARDALAKDLIPSLVDKAVF